MVRSGSTLFFCVVLLSSVGLMLSNAAVAAISPTDELVKVLPDDVLGFIATGGGDSLKADFEKSVLGRMWHDQGVKTFRDSIKKELLGKLEQEIDDPEAAEAIDSVRSLAKLILARPIIAGVAQKQAGDGPPVYGFVILDAGPRKAEIASALRHMESLADEGDIVEVEIGSAKMHAPDGTGDLSVYWGWVGSHFMIAVNDRDGLAMKHVSAPRATAPGYLKNLPGSGDALAVHGDFAKIGALVKAVAGQGQVPEEFGIVLAVLKELGLNNIKSGSARIGFAGPDVVSNSLLEMPAPRTGLFANLKTIDVSMFDMVDAGAMSATAVNCDLAGVYDTVIGAVKTVAGENFAEVKQMIAAAEAELNFKIRGGLLESLSGETIFYALPSGFSTQSPMGGLVFIAKLEDAKLLEQTLGAIGKLAAEKSGGMVQVSSQVQGERTVHTWAIMPLAMVQIMPTWTVVGDKVVIASSPVVSSLAVKQIESGTTSIRSTDGFKRATAELPGNLVSLKYGDSKLQFNQVMTSVQQFWPMATMAASNAGLKLPFVLPNLSHIAEDMGPSCQYSWFDAQGLRSRYRGTGIEVSLGAVAGGAVGLGVMMPALVRVRGVAGKAKRTQAKAHIATLSMALEMFQLDCGRYPDDAEGLAALSNPPAKLGQYWQGPYVEQDSLTDPWGNPFVYVAESTRNPGGFDLISYGADGQEGGDGGNADIVND